MKSGQDSAVVMDPMRPQKRLRSMMRIRSWKFVGGSEIKESAHTARIAGSSTVQKALCVP